MSKPRRRLESLVMSRHRTPVVVALLLAMCRIAAAQAPTGQPVTAQFLEERLPEELADEGVVLSSAHLELHVEQLGDKWLVSLVDATSKRVVHSTKIDRLPADREAAVALLTQVVANLAAPGAYWSQPARTLDSPPHDGPAQNHDATANGEAALSQRKTATLDFERQAIRVAGVYDFHLEPPGLLSVKRRWLVFRGAAGQTLDLFAFYKVVGRDDLAQSYRRRHRSMIVSYVMGGLGLATAGTLTFMALDDPAQDLVVPVVIALVVGVTGIVIGSHYSHHPHPIDENDARALADAYNQRLRKQLGISSVRREPRNRDLGLAPCIAGPMSGVFLVTRF